MGGRAVSGFLVLDDENAIAMRAPGVSEAEQLHASEAMGARLWRLLASRDDEPALKDIVAAGPPAPLTPGQRVDSAGRHIFYTHTTADDPLAGLMVKWVFAPGEAADARDTPTLDLANGEFETVV